MDPSSSAQQTDIITHLISVCSPEIVKHIFSFTFTEYASAAGVFDLAVQISPHFADVQAILQQAARTGDLPFFRYLLTTHGSNSISQYLLIYGIESCNLHIFMYLYTLFDVNSSLISSENTIEYKNGLFEKIQKWATGYSRIDILKWLRKSTFANQTNQTFAYWPINHHPPLPVLEYICDRLLAGERDGIEFDTLLLYVLRSNWDEGFTYLYSRGLRFQSWSREYILMFEYREKVTRVMCALEILPEDFCDECATQWLSKIGWWGLVGLYASGIDKEHQHLADDDSLELLYPYLRISINEAGKSRNAGVVQYLGPRYFAKLDSFLTMIYASIRSNELETLKFFAANFPQIFENLDQAVVEQELIFYYSQSINMRLKKSIVGIVRITGLSPGLYKRSKGVFFYAINAKDFEFIQWAMDKGFKLNQKELEIWRIVVRDVAGSGMEEMVKALDTRIEADDVLLSISQLFEKLYIT